MKSFINNFSFSKTIPAIVSIIFAIPFINYGLNIFRYAVNVPFMDDYDAVLSFIEAFIKAQMLDEKISLLFSQHNEHRIVFDRIVFLSSYYLFHEVDFKSYIIFGNLGWMLTTAMLVAYVQKKFHLPLYLLLPIPYLLLSFIHWENMFFAMAAIQNYWFVLFSLVFLIGLSEDNPLIFCALFPVALFTSGGGIVLYPLGNLFLALRKKWKWFVVFFVLSTSCMAFYFYNYIKPPYRPGMFEAVSTPVGSAAYFFSFLGNILPTYDGAYLHAVSLFFGLTIFLLFGYYFAVKKTVDYFLLITMGFVMLTALSATFTRSGFSVWQATSSRYSLYSLLNLVCIYILIITSAFKEAPARKIVLASAILCAMSLWGTSIVYCEYTHCFLKMREERVISLVAFGNGDKESLLYPDKNRAAQLLLTAEQQHIYNYRKQFP